jgi:hypothetical protein
MEQPGHYEGTATAYPSLGYQWRAGNKEGLAQLSNLSTVMSRGHREVLPVME